MLLTPFCSFEDIEWSNFPDFLKKIFFRDRENFGVPFFCLINGLFSLMTSKRKLDIYLLLNMTKTDVPKLMGNPPNCGPMAYGMC